MKHSLVCAFMAGAAAIVAVPAHADPLVVGSTEDITMVDLGSGIFSGAFGFAHNSNVYGTGNEAGGAFLKQFTFDAVANGLAAGSISTSLQGGSGITFAKVLLNNVPFELSDGDSFGEIFNVATVGTGNTLDVYYNAESGSRFTGEVSYAPGAIPEPATWGLMILGVGFIGAAMRKRQKVQAKISFA